eukprot:TRINITY_DN23938_c0_g1_i1.p1 TRINITY_DN23938_c0_g1~~TRINITY_DN23938_c0_g1_i1.p1  ORF type:complete len:376 (+),score=100.65 TRINITY_DN23938_c0_g1_i1:135-1262(+)
MSPQPASEVRINGKFSIGKRIGTGSFGDVHVGVNTETNEGVAIKLESVKASVPQLIYEAKLYRLIGRLRGLPQIYWYGVEGDYNVMVIELLGPSLDDLFEFCDCKFSLRTVLKLSDQILTRIESVHSRNYLHRDIKPENFVMGIGQNRNMVHLIDFGLAKRYRDPENQIHIPWVSHKNLTGTAEYASLNTHLGGEQSRRDDLESIGFMLFYFLRGNLPWQDIDSSIVTKEEKHRRIMKKKQGTPLEQLGKDLPVEYINYMMYCRQLDFEDRPDYSFPRMIWRELYFKEKYQLDAAFDWDNIYQAQKNDEELRFGIKAKETTIDELMEKLRERRALNLQGAASPVANPKGGVKQDAEEATQKAASPPATGHQPLKR